MGTKVNGFIQGLGMQPFYCLFYIQEQVELYIQQCRSGVALFLHFDSNDLLADDAKSKKPTTYYYCMLMGGIKCASFRIPFGKTQNRLDSIHDRYVPQRCQGTVRRKDCETSLHSHGLFLCPHLFDTFGFQQTIIDKLSAYVLCTTNAQGMR